MILVIDNYDSFTYNLVQLLGELGREVVVRRNDKITPDQVESLSPSHVMISPGPGHPREAGCSVEVVQRFHTRLPILGVCLGHQAIAVAAGARISRARVLMHGKAGEIHHDSSGIFRNLPNPFLAGRYHSLIVHPEGLPESLEVTARAVDGEIMAIRWKNTASVGVQFHPESILTSGGKQMIENFLEAPASPC